MYHFLTASKDASIYLQQPTQNTGLDEILEVSKTYYGSLKDVARSFIQFDTNTFSSSIAENQLPLSAQLIYSQSIETNLSASWNNAVSTSLFYSASYHASSVLYSTYSASLFTSQSNVNIYSASYSEYVSESIIEPVISFIIASASVVNLNEITTNVSESWASASVHELLISESFNIISSSYVTNLLSSSIDESYVDTQLSSSYNTNLINSASANSHSLYYSESYNSYSESLYNELIELSNLENYIINSEQSASFASQRLIAETSASYFTATTNYTIASGSTYNVLLNTNSLSSSWNTYVSQSNVYSQSYNSYSTLLNERVNNNDFVFDYSCELLLKECEASEIPLSYTIYAHPVSQSWEMGIGTRFDEISGEGITWNHKSTNTNWLLADSLSLDSTGSYNGRGGTWYTGSQSTQSFEYQTADLSIDVKNTIEVWLSGSLPNNGFIIKYDSEFENDQNDYGQLKFFSKETNTIYQPKIRIGWDDSSFATGSLTELTSDDIHVTFKRLKSRYKQGSKPEIRVFGREKYPLRTYTDYYTYNDLKYLPSTTYYQIKDIVTDDIIVPFGDYSKVSCDSNGNFFKLNLQNWETNREYYIEVKIDRDGVIEYFSDRDLTFLVEK